MARKKTNFFNSAVLNNSTYAQYYNRLLEISLSMFEWTGLPETVDPRFMELTLFSNGQCVFFEDEVLGFLGLQCMANGPFDVYNVPINRRAFASNGYQNSLDSSNSVIIYNNYMRSSSALDVKMFAMRLYNLDRAIDVNANAQKTPILITCDETQKLTMANLYKQYDGNMPVIWGDKALSASQVSCVRTDAPFVADKLYELKTKIWNEALTYLGVSNLSVQKKERLITDEVQRNQGGTLACRYSRLEARRQACRQINDMFGLDVWCNYREDAVSSAHDKTLDGGELDE